jgi:hypothetical protein
MQANESNVKKKPPGFMLYDEASESLLVLSDHYLGVVIKAAIRYKLFSITPETLEDSVMFPYQLLRLTIDRDVQKYTEKCKKNAENRAAATKSKPDDS